MKKLKIRAAGLILWLVLVLIVVAIVLLVVLKKPPPEVPRTAEKPVAVQVLEVVPRSLPDRVVIPGRVQAMVEATLSSERNGRIVELAADRGDRVTKGQVLMRLDSRLPDAMLKQARIELEDARRDEKRYTELNETGAVAASDFDAIRTRRATAEVVLEQAAVMVSQCKLESPIDGVVNDRTVEEGEYALEGVPVFSVVSVDPVKVVVNIPERDIGAVQVGDALSFEVAAVPGTVFTGTVRFVAEAAARGANAFPVEIATPNPERALRPGMVAEVSLVRRVREGVMVLPLAAVIPSKGEELVYVLAGDRAAGRVVRVDAIVGHEAVISGGIEPGDRVIVRGHRALQDGTLVELVETKAREP
jgi:membrane fusion protein (multidrug efflux system)